MSSFDTDLMVKQLGPPLYRYFLSRMPQPLAEEAVQEVFLRLILPNRFDESKGSINGFVWGLAINVQRELLRKYGSVQESKIEVASESQDNPDFAALRQAVTALEEPDRQIFQLLLADLALATIAEVMQMPDGTVKSHIHRGKEKLKKTMTKWGYE